MPPRSRSKASKRNNAKRSLKGASRGVTPPLEPPVASQHEVLSARISRELMETFTTAFSPAGTPPPPAPNIKALYDVMKESYAVYDSMLGELTLDPPIACKSGCIHCCYNQIAMTEPEALFLGMYLLETRDAQQLQALTAKTRAMVDKLHGMNWHEIGMTRHLLPCIFLEKGNCSVYPARPMACRGWNSIDEGMCINSNTSGDAMTPIENHAIMRLLAESIQTGVLRGASSLGLETGFLLMCRAVMLLLEDEAEKGVLECMNNWLNGRPFFAQKTNW